MKCQGAIIQGVGRGAPGFSGDGFGVESWHKLDLDVVAWTCDYPRSDSARSPAPESLALHLDGVPTDDAASSSTCPAREPK